MIDKYNRPEAYEHYNLIRTSPEYRMELMAIDMEAKMQPSLCQDIPDQEIEIPVKRPYRSSEVYDLRRQVRQLTERINKITKKPRQSKYD